MCHLGKLRINLKLFVELLSSLSDQIARHLGPDISLKKPVKFPDWDHTSYTTMHQNKFRLRIGVKDERQT